MAGISPETRILAVNKDANADIFRFATAGCVADWEQLLPELLEVLDVNASATTSS
jgi:electron transfer flavoprotein alpha subunit